jgi:hypothetical protein
MRAGGRRDMHPEEGSRWLAGSTVPKRWIQEDSPDEIGEAVAAFVDGLRAA